jgi:septal ring factor EnvC (AmiA/AmiB activator)
LTGYVWPEPAANVEAPAAATTSPRTVLMAIAAIGALAVTLCAAGWGFTQWSSANDWRTRSQTMEAQFDKLEQRVEVAERQRVKSQRALVKTRNQLEASDKKLAASANQLAVTRDVRVEFCEALPGLLPPEIEARLCA